MDRELTGGWNVLLGDDRGKIPAAVVVDVRRIQILRCLGREIR